MKLGNVFLATVMLTSTASVTALFTQKRDSTNPQFSPFTLCIQKNIADFPYSSTKPSTAQVKECLKQAGTTEQKRSISEQNQARDDNPESVFVAGADLDISRAPVCDGKEVHDNFLWVSDIRDFAVDACQNISNQVDGTDLAMTGVVTKVTHPFHNGHDKQGHQLKDDRSVTAAFTLAIYPPAKAQVDNIKEIASGVMELCQRAITKIATKNKGCTQEIGYYRPSRAKHYTGTAAIGGYLDMLWKGSVAVARLSVGFSNDN